MLNLGINRRKHLKRRTTVILSLAIAITYASSVVYWALLLYEAFGGHAQAFLRIFGALPIVKAYETNILEDEGAELNIFRAAGDDNTNDVEIKLNFRGFEFKTVKLVLGDTNGVTAIDECVPHS